LGALYFDILDYESSKMYYETTLKIMSDQNDTSWIARIYGNLAGVYFMSQDYAKSIETLNKSIELGISIGNYTIVGGALSNLAQLYMSLNDENAAFEAYDRGAFLLDSVGDKRGVCITFQEKGDALVQHNKLVEARNMYKKVLLTSE